MSDFLRNWFSDPLLGLAALLALGVVAYLSQAAFRGFLARRRYHRHLERKHRQPTV